MTLLLNGCIVIHVPTIQLKTERDNAQAQKDEQTLQPKALHKGSTKNPPKKRANQRVTNCTRRDTALRPMPCYHPLRGYYSRARTPQGKRIIVFNQRHGFIDRPITLPCGRCKGCRRKHARMWAIRCVHEASLHDDNCMVTLTYSPQKLPEGETLVKTDWRNFIRRLRKHHSDRCEERGTNVTPIRYFHCGEYGKLGRPHFHGLLFGFAFSDMHYLHKRGDYPVYRSETLEKLWDKGLSEVGTVTYQSAAYVAKYVVKKFRPDKRKGDVKLQLQQHYNGKEPEYSTMSRRPGIGTEWIKKYREEVMRNDSIIIQGKEVQPPRFYDAVMEKTNPEQFTALKGKRKRAVDPEEQTDERLAVKETVAQAKDDLYERSKL